ncbi:hypothetical protein BFW38_02985 [Terasakiispira papahanaumokuakeensis]|uniref:DUF3465 domain-containing protein n=1 Tax=Terasakiispira papahanaumokuakeensis TaxID=197479 RepID=A0A1E2V6X2_9GAMM|nr:DUF3465 domain-containing protein [Terasakiispira papahanaumokuakeensis]ODC02663.1 hypothetical protein BFW38_02985 [Terasakiispira papahanaumokuakeensis]
MKTKHWPTRWFIGLLGLLLSTLLYADDATLIRLYRQGAEGVQVQGQGEVIRLLADDLKGRRHQRFILALSSGQTLLVAHNIDLAPSIDHLAIGDKVSFYGEYTWNRRGGIIHWTHHDPDGRHPDGWLEHDGKRYQ